MLWALMLKAGRSSAPLTSRAVDPGSQVLVVAVVAVVAVVGVVGGTSGATAFVGRLEHRASRRVVVLCCFPKKAKTAAGSFIKQR